MERPLGSTGSVSPLVDLRDVVKAYPTPAGDFLALKGVDLEVETGEFVAVIGKSGSGKSTLINAIAGIDRPTSGEVRVAGTAVQDLDENAVAAWRGRHLGVIFQFFQLLPTLTLVENVMLPMEFARRGSARERRDRALTLLERVEMGDHAHKLPSGVSGGQQQRVAIARALANNPALIVADEPTGSLDSRTSETVFQLFEELVDGGTTILMVTHDDALASRADRVVLIVDGEIVEAYVRSALAGISERDLVDVTARLDPQIHPPGATIYAQGDAAAHFFIVVRGALEIVRSGRVVEAIGPGQHFGEQELLHGKPRLDTVRVAASGDASLLALDGDVFRRLATDNQLASGAIAKVVRRQVDADTVRRATPEGVDLAGHVARRRYEPGEPIEEPDRFFVVLAGEVDVMAGEERDRRYRAGRWFGTAAVGIADLRAGADGATVASISLARYARIVAAAGLPDEHLALLVADSLSK